MSTHAAVVGTKRHPRLMVGTLPLARRAADGSVDPVDLTLEDQGDVFVPAEPVTPLALPGQLDDGISIGNGHVRVAVEPGQAGNATGTLVADSSEVLYPDVRQDTDALVVPREDGVEEFSQLRSAQSPEDLTFDFSSSEGAASLDSGQDGSVSVHAGGGVVASVTPVSATDAQGQDVPVTTSVNGDRMTVHVAHRDDSYAYPITVDPIVQDNAKDGAGNYTRGWKYCPTTTTYAECADDLSALSYWPTYGSANTGFSTATYNVDPNRWPGDGSANGTAGNPWYRGLFVWAAPGRAFSATEYKEFYWRVPHAGPTNSSFISRMDFGWNNLWLGSDPTGNPQIYDGLWASYCGSGGAWANLRYIPETTRYQGNWTTLFPDDTGGGYYSTAPCTVLSQKAEEAVFGMRFSGATSGRSAWATAYLGGAIITMDDKENPTWSSAPTWSGTLPTGWTNTNASYTPASGMASDAGLGMEYLQYQVNGPTMPDLTPSAAAAAVAARPTRVQWCDGSSVHVCPTSINLATSGAAPPPAPLDTSAFDDGDHTIAWTAYDVLGKATTYTQHLKIDRTKPSGSIAGLAEGQAIKSGSYPVTATGSDALSGVQQVTLQQDGVTVAQQSGCTGQTCSVSATVNATASGLAEGNHTLTVVTTDQAGNTSSTPVTFIVDRTAPHVAQSGPLWDIRGQVIDEASGVDVDATDPGPAPQTGGVTSIELLEDGADPYPTGNHRTQTCASPGCSMSTSYDYHPGALTPGTHSIDLRVDDAAGNRTDVTWQIIRDADPPDRPSTPNCSTSSPSTVLPVAAADVDTAAQAEASVRTAFPQLLAASTTATVDDTDNASGVSMTPYWTRGGTTFSSTQTLAKTQLSTGSSPSYTLGDGAAAVCVSPTATTANATLADLPAPGGAAVYANVEPAIDMIVRPSLTGPETFEQIRKASAPETMTWSVALHDDQQLRSLSDGNVAIVTPTDPGADPVVDTTPDPTITADSDGAAEWIDRTAPEAADPAKANDTQSNLQLADAAAQSADASLPDDFEVDAVYSVPWARDSQGSQVPTALSVSGNTITLTVRHHTGMYAYPIVADPAASDAETTQEPSNEAAQRSDDPYRNCYHANVCGKWDMDRALKHARDYAKTYSPDFFHPADDCTEYLSQVVYFGRSNYLRAAPSRHIYRRGLDSWWQQDYLHEPAQRGPNNGDRRETHSWSVAHDLYHQLLAVRLAKKVSLGSMRKGDLVFFDWTYNGRGIDHAGVILTGSHPDTTKMMYAQHTGNHIVSWANEEDRATDYDQMKGGTGAYRVYVLRMIHANANTRDHRL